MSGSDDTELRSASTSERSQDSSTVDAFHMEIEEYNLPELSSYVSAGKFWCKFAAWPLVFFIVNFIVLESIRIADEYQHTDWGQLSDDSEKSDFLAMLRYKATLYSIILFVDAGLLYFAARKLEKDGRALDDVQTERDSADASTPSRLGTHVHAQVSRRLDVILGRGPRPRVSIFISLLLLASTIGTAFGFVLIGDLRFSWNPEAAKVCPSQYGDYDIDVEGIPQELQPWAKRRGFEVDDGKNVVRLTDGTTYIVAADPTSNSTMRADYREDWASKNILLVISTKGTIEVFSNVSNLQLFVVPSGADILQTPVSCSLFVKAEKLKRAGRYYGSLSMLCADLSGVRIISLDRFNAKRHKPLCRRILMESASLRWFNNSFYAKVSWGDHSGAHGYDGVDYYSLEVGEGNPLQPVLVHSTAHRGGFSGFDSYSLIGGETGLCRHWRKVIASAMLIAVFAPGTFWLLYIRNMSVGAVPAFGALAALLYCIDIDLALAVCTMLAAVSFLKLQGCRVPLTKAMGSEELVWILYASVIAVVTLATRRSGDVIIFVLIACLVVGSLLGHPALYLVGWIGGTVLVLFGAFSLLDPSSFDPWAYYYFPVGIIGGVGCVSVGKVLITYRAYTSFYAKQTYRAICKRLQLVAPSNIPRPERGSLLFGRNEGSSMTAGLLTHDS